MFTFFNFQSKNANDIYFPLFLTILYNSTDLTYVNLFLCFGHKKTAQLLLVDDLIKPHGRKPSEHVGAFSQLANSFNTFIYASRKKSHKLSGFFVIIRANTIILVHALWHVKVEPASVLKYQPSNVGASGNTPVGSMSSSRVFSVRNGGTSPSI